MYIMIKNANGQHCEYTYKADSVTDDEVISAAIKKYIAEKLDGYSSRVFPVSQDLWTSKIDNSGHMTTKDKIELLNSLCRHPALKITDVFIGYTLAYGEDKAIDITNT